MPRTSSSTELRKQPLEDLRREVAAKRLTLAKMRMGLRLQKEKNSGVYKAEKRELARMLTVMNEKNTTEQLLKKKNATTLPARKNSSTSQS